ncbi:bck1-like resistance to osmotic shock [Pleurotus ostreatus]|nr:bck1-like resistance to osmotic shock [Pleurotus ostreatus]
MAHQSPMISIPKKTTEEVDWTTPIRNLVAQSYGESPDNYAAECASLQRCRQDAVRGAGSDMTARDLLYKYFGQLELLELRFSEIRVSFPWHDAFTNKLITQTSIAYEKASILFQIASTHSAIAASQNRSDPEGLKRAFYYFRTCAGMLTYINENFLHAPSTDLSRDVVRFLINIIIAQATEVFFEKCTDEKKGSALVAKIGAQAAALYTILTEDVKEFMGKGIFDRNWVTLLQIKSKYFSSLAQYHRGLADSAAGKHGDALVRFTQAESLAKEASRTAATFGSVFVTNMSPNLPADAGSSIQERTKAHLAICSEKKAEATRENDLIYNAILPSAEALPVIDKLSVATPISIQDVYGSPEVQKVIGPDLFVRLIPLSVHESASVYSEEKAKLVRGEVENAETAEGEVRSALDALAVKDGIVRFRAMAEGELGGGEDIPMDVRRFKEDISIVEDREGVEGLMAELQRKKDAVRQVLETISRDLDVENRDCEMMRVKYGHEWTQAPSASLTKSIRQDLKSHFSALEAASASDQQVSALWDSVRNDIHLLLSDDIEDVFRASTERGNKPMESLLDLDVSTEADEATERAKIGQLVTEIDERLNRLTKISKERAEVLKDLKDKIQSDDVSHLLLLNRRNSGVEPALFANELEKFRPYQQRLAATVVHQQAALQEVAQLWKTLKDSAGRGPGAKKWDEREKRKRDTVRRFSRARDVYMEIRDGLAKGLQFYTELTDLSASLSRNTKSFIASRVSERNSLSAQLETEKKLSASASPPPVAPKPPVPPLPSRSDLSSSFASMNLGRGPPTPPVQHQYQQHTSPPPPPPSQHRFSPPPSQGYAPPQPQYNQHQPLSHPDQQPQRHFSLPPPPPPPSHNSFRPPPPPPQSDPYAALDMFDRFAASAPPPPPPSQQQQYQQQQSQYPQSGYTQNYQQAQQGQYTPQSMPPPPPAPISYQWGQPAPPPPQQQPGQYQSYANQPTGYGQSQRQY